MLNVYYGGTRTEHIIGKAKTKEGAIRLGKRNKIITPLFSRIGYSIGVCELDAEIHGRSGFSLCVGKTYGK